MQYCFNNHFHYLSITVCFQDFTASIGDLKKMYPKWNQFCEIRKKYDPNGVFLNDNLSRMFGHNKEAV